MLPVPQEQEGKKRALLATLPWACLGFFITYLLVMLVAQHGEQEQEAQLGEWYQSSGLFKLEWPNYLPWLRISGQFAKADDLEAALSRGEVITLIRAMGYDEAFEEENMTRGSQYWSAKEQIKWQELREQFAQKSLSLVRTRFGLNPTAPRPSTYLTWHFLQESVMQWLVALLLLLPFAWPLEAKLGWQRMIVLWFGSGVIAGMFYVLFMQSSYLPLIGATPITSALIGAYLGLFALQKMTFVWFHPKLKAWQKKELPAWLPAPLWLLLPLYEAFGGASAPHAWIALVAALLAGVGLAQLVRPHDIMGIDEEKEEETDTEKLQRQKLGSAWASMQALEFRDAERQFEASLKAGPGFAALTGLYQVRKLHPETAEFEDTALKVLRYQTSEIGEMRQQMHIYRDYIKRIIDLDKLPADTRTVLATHFCLIEEMREADRIAESLAEEKVVTDLSLRMYQTLADKFERFGQISKANHYAHQADKVKKALAASTQPLQGNA